MAIYQYLCEKCSATHEGIYNWTDKVHCPKCKAIMEKTISPPARTPERWK